MGSPLSALLNLLKWPIAAAVALLTPAGAAALWPLLVESWNRSLWWTPFGVGFIAALGSWTFVARLRPVRFWCTMEHELTHALFAWMTLVPVLELRSTDGTMHSEDNSAGHVRLGGSNWLISISPYFFPTLPAALLLATWALATQPSPLARALLGAATAFSLTSTWQETHRHQVDLRRVGFLFSWLFLPGANLLAYGLLLANELAGPAGAIRYAVGAFTVTCRWMGF